MGEEREEGKDLQKDHAGEKPLVAHSKNNINKAEGGDGKGPRNCQGKNGR